MDDTGFNVQSFVSTGAPFQTDWESAESCPRLQQTGIPRINCVDCLDRTNLGMLALGQEALRRQLLLLGCPLSNPTSKSSFDRTLLDESSWKCPLPAVILRQLSELWGTVGDDIAMAYAGSGAMHRADITLEIQEGLRCCSVETTERDQEVQVGSQLGLSGNQIEQRRTGGLFSSCFGERMQPSSNDRVSEEFGQLMREVQPLMEQQIFKELQRASGDSLSETRWKAKKRSNVSVAVQRYLHNVFGDLDRQRALDLILGKFRPKYGSPTIWEVELFPYPESSNIQDVSLLQSIHTTSLPLNFIL